VTDTVIVGARDSDVHWVGGWPRQRWPGCRSRFPVRLSRTQPWARHCPFGHHDYSPPQRQRAASAANVDRRLGHGWRTTRPGMPPASWPAIDSEAKRGSVVPGAWPPAPVHEHNLGYVRSPLAGQGRVHEGRHRCRYPGQIRGFCAVRR